MKTATPAAVVEAKSLAKIAALSNALLTKTVLRAWPFQRTVELLMKPDPFTAKVKLELPTVELEGDRDVSTGTGLDGELET